MFSRFTFSSALTISAPPAIYPAGSTIAGEVEIDFPKLQEENIQEVHLRLRGSSKTVIHRDKSTFIETIPLVRNDTTLWSRAQPSCPYPPPDTHTLRLPFAFVLPPQLPSSFHFHSFGRERTADVRYSLTAVGVRPGLLTVNKKHRVPLAVVPRDETGAVLTAGGATHAMKTRAKEDRVRKGFWGEYATVRVELALPDIPVLPLFSDIPYTITVRTTSAPLSRAKADAQPADKPVFPPAPATPEGVQFVLHRQLKLRAKYARAGASGDVATFLGTKRTSKSPVESDVPAREWVPLDSGGSARAERGEKGEQAGGEDGAGGAGRDAMGTWVQRATFRSTFRLDCAPTFAVHNIECDYELIVKVPFPGIGNDLRLDVPVTVTSGLDRPLPRGEDQEGDGSQPTLDLPPAYWDVSNEREWGDDEKA